MIHRLIVLTSVCLVIAGCSRGLLGGSSPSPEAQQQQISVNNELVLPPDLSLRQPGTGVASSYRAPADNSQISAAPLRPSLSPGASNPRDPLQPQLDKYNISRLNPDGTVKKQGQLLDEIRQAVLAEKRRQNPNYGTIFNSGELFDDN